MKKTLLVLVLSLSAWAQAAVSDSAVNAYPELQPTSQEVRAAHMAADILSRYHYKAMPLDQALSEKIFDRYLTSLDAEKIIFVQADVDRFAGDRSKIGPAIRQDDLSVPFAIYNLYEHRVAQRYDYARELLKTGFDFSTNERMDTARQAQPWPQSQAELDDLWRKRVKNEWLSLKLAGKDDASIVTTLDKRYERVLKRLEQTQSSDVFQTFMNAYTMSIEPHTNYMGPRAAEEFDISMRLSLEGIGAVISDADDFATIKELTAGGPALLSGQLNVGDRIVGVAQGDTGVMVDAVGMRPDDLISLIRGPQGSVVKLAILPAAAVATAGPQKMVSLTRQPIGLEDEAAKSSIQTVQDGAGTRRIGIITLPTFYEDFAAKQAGDANYKNAARDVQRLLTAFKASKVDGVLVDLRNNGGGSLAQAVELTSLFIGKKPVVQQRNAQGNISVGWDTTGKVEWSGPMGVLINKRSASASEIFAAAIQDYGRGVVMGQSSFGKGTVQSMIDLDELVSNDKPQLGELKMTVAQFFRVNGGTTQLKGVAPDISFPGLFDEATPGESAYANALPWTMIKAVHNAPNASVKAILPALAKKHASRIKADPDFQNLHNDIAALKRERDKKDISLNEAQRRAERQAMQSLLAARQLDSGAATAAASPTPNGMALDDGLLPGERSLSEELRAEQMKKSVKDIVLIEATRVLRDAVGLLQTSGTWS